MRGWKVLTHDYRPPIQGGKPVFDGTFPHEFPEVELDRSDSECGSGWNFCSDLHTAFRIAGLWPDGRPSVAIRVKCRGGLKRGDKCRAKQITAERFASDIEISDTVREMSQPFGEFCGDMHVQQMAWRKALARPKRDTKTVEAMLRLALDTKSLDWSLRRFDSVWVARAAWAAWDARDERGAWDAWDAWGAWAARAARAASDAWAARAAWDAWDARAASDARAARAAWDASDAWDAWDARAAWDAFVVFYASKMGWVDYPCDYLTAGIIDAYDHGLAIAIPTGENELGYAMVAKDGGASDADT